MGEPKTRPHGGSVTQFINGVRNETRRKDARTMLRVMNEITGEKAVMWGPSLIGFGTYQYTYKSGHSGEWFLTGFSPRKDALTVYIMAGFDRYDALMKKLGTYRTGKSCLYIKNLEDVDMKVLRQLIRESAKHVANHGGC